MGKEVTDVIDSCPIEAVLARLMVRLRASSGGSIAGSVMLSSGSLQKSEDVVGDMGGDNTVSMLLWEDPLLWGALQRHETLLMLCSSMQWQPLCAAWASDRDLHRRSSLQMATAQTRSCAAVQGHAPQESQGPFTVLSSCLMISLTGVARQLQLQDMQKDGPRRSHVCACK